MAYIQSDSGSTIIRSSFSSCSIKNEIFRGVKHPPFVTLSRAQNLASASTSVILCVGSRIRRRGILIALN